MPITEYIEKPNNITLPASKFFIVVNDDNVIVNGAVESFTHNTTIDTNSKIVTGTKLQVEKYITDNALTFLPEE
jgi:hypothetical protein